jgi:hypothetical protein
MKDFQLLKFSNGGTYAEREAGYAHAEEKRRRDKKVR